MDQQFWMNAPKIFCQDTGVGFMGGVGNSVLLALLSGGNAQVFALTPEHAKRFSQMLAYNLENYEKTNGQIVVEDWIPDKKSPIQVQDLKNDSAS